MSCRRPCREGEKPVFWWHSEICFPLLNRVCMVRLPSWSQTLRSSCLGVKKGGISLRQLQSFYIGMMRGRKSRQMQLVKIRTCSAASLSGCFCVGHSPNKAASPEPWTPYSLTEGRSLQASGISVSGKPGKYSLHASNTSCWQAYLAGSRHWSKHAVCFARFTKVGLIPVLPLKRVWGASCGPLM